jgi:uncharacterized membrane protein
MGTGKLDTADSFDRIFALYTRQFATLIGAALVIYIPIGILSGLVVSNRNVALLVVLGLLSAIGSALYTGAVVEAVEDMRDGRRDFSATDLLRAAVPYLLPLIVAGILYGLAVTVGFILLIVPGLLFLTWFALYAPVIVVEKRGIFDAFTRSRELVRGNGWRVFGVIVVTFILQSVIQSLLSQIGINADSLALRLILSVVAGVITAPISALAASVVYFQLRDLERGAPAPAATPPVPPPAAY